MTQKILLADDSVTIQKVIELTFMDEDYEVTTAGNGEEALERLESMSPDVVIADVHMPGASGFDVARRSKELHPTTPVLLLVGTFEPFDEDELSASGADSYLKKPFDSQELLQRVGELLDSRAASGAAAPAPAAGTTAGPADYESAPTASLQPSFGDDATATPAAAPDATSADQVGGWGAEPPSEAEPVAPSDATAGTGVALGAGAEEPFPDLATPAAGAPGDDDVFRGLGDADGSSQVMPPPDLEDDLDDDRYDEDFDLDSADDYEIGDDQTLGGALDDEQIASEEPELQVDEPEELVTGDDWADGTAGSDVTGTVRPEVAPERGGEGGGVAPGAGTVAVSTAGWQTQATEVAGDPASSGADAAAAGGALSDGDVDRIARRLAEILGSDVVREVAWEVVPDLAEVVIKDRLRELESQVD